jgi:ribosome-binding protein aMBF1 (putative translation factor)
MIVYRCDICHEVRECSQREIEQAEYDVCSECWEALAFKLKGKGRSKRQAVIIPPAPAIPEPTAEPKQPFPGAPPTIYAGADRLN